MPAYRYEFDESISFEEAQETLVLSRIAVASALGESRARLEIADCTHPNERCIEISANSVAGQMLNRIFTGYLAREFTPNGFRVNVLDAGSQPMTEVELA